MNNLILFSFIKPSQFFLFLKFGFLLINLLAIIFLLVVIKQILTMDHIVHDENDFGKIKGFAYLLLLISVSLFLVSLGIL